MKKVKETEIHWLQHLRGTERLKEDSPQRSNMWHGVWRKGGGLVCLTNMVQKEERAMDLAFCWFLVSEVRTGYWCEQAMD